MAKVTGQNVPAPLQQLWNQLHSPNKAAQGAAGAIKVKKNTSKPTKKPRRNLDLIALQAVAELVAKEHYTDRGRALPQHFVFNLTQDLVLGIFSAQYFKPCILESAETLESTPTYTADANPPPYGFRTPLFMPSVPVYPSGIATALPPSYTGEKQGTLFADSVLRWRKLVFKADAIDLNKGENRVLLRWETRIDIVASARGSKPMLSLNLKAALSTNTAGALSSTEAPIMLNTTFYWRFKIPPSTPPYFNSYQVRKEVRALSRIVKKTGTGLFTRYVLNAANRPMMGRGFNNNNTVHTSFTTDPELWEIRDPCLEYKLEDGNVWTWDESATVSWQITLTSPGMYVNPSGQASLQVSLTLDDGTSTHSFNAFAFLSGSWAQPGVDSLPFSSDVRVIGASCDGSRVILHVSRYATSYKKAARGFVLLTLTSDTTATLSTIADNVDCWPVKSHQEAKDFPPYGLQYWHWWTDPTTFWCWFNDMDAVEQIKNEIDHVSDYPYSSGTIHMKITIDGVEKSYYHQQTTGPQANSSNIDGYSDNGRMQAWNSMDLSNRCAVTNDYTFYASVAQHPNEQSWPMAWAVLAPSIIASKKVTLGMTMLRYIYQNTVVQTVTCALPDYVISDIYTGKIIEPGSVSGTPSHEVVDP